MKDIEWVTIERTEDKTGNLTDDQIGLKGVHGNLEDDYI